ncbi:MAG: hypothetical protein AAF384_19995 [Pseudomonadota bacterium]
MTKQILSLALILMAFSPALTAQDEEKIPLRTTPQTELQEEVAEDQECVHACRQWENVCNIDPRGFRKCQRRCRSFGLICE